MESTCAIASDDMAGARSPPPVTAMTCDEDLAAVDSDCDGTIVTWLSSEQGQEWLKHAQTMSRPLGFLRPQSGLSTLVYATWPALKLHCSRLPDRNAQSRGSSPSRCHSTMTTTRLPLPLLPLCLPLPPQPPRLIIITQGSTFPSALVETCGAVGRSQVLGSASSFHHQNPQPP